MFRSGVSFRVLSRSNPPRNAAANSFRFRSYVKRRILHYFGANKSFRIRSYRHPSSNPFRIRSYKNTGGGGYPNTFASPASSLQYPASRTICATWRLHPLSPHSIAHTSCHHGGVRVLWQLCCLGEFLVISMIHLHSSEVVARCGLDFLCAGYFQWGLSRHMRVRFNAVVAMANSAATFLSPPIRNA